MMFALREIAVSLTFFVVLYCCFSLIVLAGWRGLRRLQFSQKTLAKALFVTRVLPMLASASITCAFVVPSFQILEPRETAEGIGRLPFVLGIAAISLVVFGFYRAFRAQAGSTQIVAGWLKSAQPLGSNLYKISRSDVPPLSLVGLRKPRILISDLTLELLTAHEMGIALRHEQAHIRYRDNLRKLIFRFCPFPGMGPLEIAWAEASELAADDAAVSSADEAVDLASALVKLSRLVPIESTPVCTVGFVTGWVSLRISRLLAWDEMKERRSQVPGWAAFSVVAGAVFLLFITYAPALVITHEITEALVR